MNAMSTRTLDPKKLAPDEEMMWRTAEASTEVPSFYVKELLMRLRGVATAEPKPLMKAGELVRVLRGEWKDCSGVTQEAELGGYVAVILHVQVSLSVDILTKRLHQ